MRRSSPLRAVARIAVALGATIGVPALASAQEMRRREPPPAGAPRVPAPGPLPGAPTLPRHPYAGVWRGVRNLPVGSNELHLRFTLENGAYLGQIVHRDGSETPATRVSDGATGISWDMPNSGGGTWRYRMRLVAPDSIAGTLELMDAPPGLTPAPKGTIAARRVSAPSR